MLHSRIAESFGMCLLVSLLSVAARGEVLISYVSDIDRDPSTPDVIDLNLGESSMITISLTPLDGEVDFGGGGFLFEGEPAGSPGVLRNGVIEVSDFSFDAQLDPCFFVTNDLPGPGMAGFIPGCLSMPMTLATVAVTAVDVGTTVQDTGPVILGGGMGPYPLADGSESFTVRGIPEPATPVLLLVATAMLARRRADARCSA